MNSKASHRRINQIADETLKHSVSFNWTAMS